MPSVTPKRHGNPPRTPALAPVAVSNRLLGPGVPAAATAKSRNATARSGVMTLAGWYNVMVSTVARARDGRLERSCRAGRPDWVRTRRPVDGVELLQAWFAGRGYDRHRHDTYAIGLTDIGVQVFDYRG